MEEKDSKIRVVMVNNGEGNMDVVNLKKSFDGWRVIYPIRNSDGSINWFNLLTGGSWFKLFVVAIIVIVVIGTLMEYMSSLKYCAEFIQNYSQVDIKNISLVLPG